MFTTPGLHTRFFREFGELHRYALEQSERQNVYFGLGLIHGTPTGRGKTEDVGGIGTLWCDIDIHSPAHDRDNLPRSFDEAHGLLREMPVPASEMWLSITST